jgi:hypothetical protein
MMSFGAGASSGGWLYGWPMMHNMSGLSLMPSLGTTCAWKITMVALCFLEVVHYACLCS